MIRRIFFSFAIAFALVACQSSETSIEETNKDMPEPIPTAVETSGKLVALVDNSISSYYIFKGQPRGFEYELLRWFCKEHDLTLEVRVMPHFEDVLDSLLAGVGDIGAANLTVTTERSERFNFTPYVLRNRQVLVQRQPPEDAGLSRREKEKMLVTDALDLNNKRVHVHESSAFYKRLQNIAEENAIQIEIESVPNDIDTEELIELVSKGKIDFTVIDENRGKLLARLYPELHFETPLSLSQSISWATRKESDSLHSLLSEWIERQRYSNKFAVIYRKYFHPSRTTVAGMQSSFNLAKGGKLSLFDDIFKREAERYGFDWRFLAAVSFQESKFNPQAESSFGARGLMQLMPATAERFGVNGNEVFIPERNVNAGTAFLRYLYNYWERKLEDQSDINKFVLASYNAGLGHVIDARKLAAKFELNDEKWEGNVSDMLLKKSIPKYYNDPVVKHGYCRGREPVQYVTNVMEYFTQYVLLSPGLSEDLISSVQNDFSGVSR
ncbi:MAG: transporter substrate-binding domain-containing protein [Cryomorphaceae bacterium]|nr:transporter substrate-binding domain-containing protein [Cryomorphaceae bacterium]